MSIRIKLLDETKIVSSIICNCLHDLIQCSRAMLDYKRGKQHMSKLTEFTKAEDFDQVWEKSTEGPVLVFKQSTTCPISADAFEQFQEYLTGDVAPAYFVKVRETREVSNHIAEVTGIQHQSPQILLINNKEVVWKESHNKITVGNIKEQVAKLS